MCCYSNGWNKKEHICDWSIPLPSHLYFISFFTIANRVYCIICFSSLLFLLLNQNVLLRFFPLLLLLLLRLFVIFGIFHFVNFFFSIRCDISRSIDETNTQDSFIQWLCVECVFFFFFFFLLQSQTYGARHARPLKDYWRKI